MRHPDYKYSGDLRSFLRTHYRIQLITKPTLTYAAGPFVVRCVARGLQRIPKTYCDIRGRVKRCRTWHMFQALLRGSGKVGIRQRFSTAELSDSFFLNLISFATIRARIINNCAAWLAVQRHKLSALHVFKGKWWGSHLECAAIPSHVVEIVNRKVKLGN